MTTDTAYPCNKERVKLFVDALRSFEYEDAGQVCGALCLIADGKPKYCALGIAFEVAIKNGLEGFTRSTADGVAQYSRNDQANDDHRAPYYTVSLPIEVADWYGFDSVYASGFPCRMTSKSGASAIQSLDWWNDHGKSLRDMADAVEAMYLSDSLLPDDSDDSAVDSAADSADS